MGVRIRFQEPFPSFRAQIRRWASAAARTNDEEVCSRVVFPIQNPISHQVFTELTPAVGAPCNVVPLYVILMYRNKGEAFAPVELGNLVKREFLFVLARTPVFNDFYRFKLKPLETFLLERVSKFSGHA